MAALSALTALASGCALFPTEAEDEAPTATAPAPPAERDQPTPEGQVGAAGAASSVAAFDIDVRTADKDLRALLDTHLALQRYRAVTDLDEVEIERLMALAERDARNLLGTQGYFSPTVHIRLEVPPEGRQRVVVEVEPGEPTTISEVNIEFEGDLATSTDADAAEQRAAIEDDWSLSAGERFTQDGWSGAKRGALRQLVARRYPVGKISYSVADVNAAAAQAKLGVRLDSGPPYHLGAFSVRGADRYPPELAPRLSWLQPGQVYDQAELIRAQQRLIGSGYYDSAVIGIDTEGDPAAVPVSMTVTEAKTQRVQLGVGFSTDGGPRLSVEHRHNKIFGTTWRADTMLRLNTKTPLLQTELTGLPNERGWRWGGLARWERIDDGALVTTGQSLRFGRSKFTERFDRNIYVQLDYARVGVSTSATSETKKPSAAQIGDGAALSMNYDGTLRFFDDLTFPHRGHGLGLNLGAGTTMVGKKTPFARVVGRWLGLYPVGDGGSRLALRSELGAIIGSKTGRLPGTYLFRTGGNTSVRGYGFRDIGIRLADDSVGPGRYMAVSSVEWQRPIMQARFGNMLEHALFVDAGGVANRFQDLRAHVGVGTGIRARTPVGPMQFDVAWGLKSKSLKLHLNVGFVF